MIVGGTATINEIRGIGALGPLAEPVKNMRVVKSGLKSDDRVVVKGLMQARPGAKVTPQETVPAQTSVSSAKGN